MLATAITEVDYALANLDRRMVIGPYEQYGRELDVPAKRTKVLYVASNMLVYVSVSVSVCVSVSLGIGIDVVRL